VPPTPGRYRAKALATLALQSRFERMLYPCTATAATIPLFALGAPGQVAALTIGAIGSPLCLANLKTVDSLAQVVEDPLNPAAAINRVTASLGLNRRTLQGLVALRRVPPSMTGSLSWRRRHQDNAVSSEALP
jgi:hypothetical protein